MATSIDRASNSVSNENFDLLFKTFKNENFLKYLGDVAKQFSEPRKWNQFDCEYKKLENKTECGTSSLHSTPGFALQARRLDNDSIVYINIIVSDEIDNPSVLCAKEKCSSNLKRCIPHAILKPRLEFRAGELFSEWLSTTAASDSVCSELESSSVRIKEDGVWIYDVVVSPVCFELSRENLNVKDHVIETALEGIRNQLKIELNHVKTLGFDLYVGNPVVSQQDAAKTSVSFGEEKSSRFITENKIQSDKNKNNVNMGFSQMPSKLTGTEKVESNSIFDLGSFENENKWSSKFQSGADIPKYKLKHVNNFSLQDYSIMRTNKPKSLRPQSLILEVNLPEILSASEIDVNVSGKGFNLKTQKNKKYNLDIILPYEVDEEPKMAKFNLSLSVLQIELNVRKQIVQSADLFDHDVEMLPKYLVENNYSADCESGYRTNSDCDTSSISSHEESVSDNMESGKTAINYLSPVMPVCKLTQSDKFLFINIDLINVDVKTMMLKIISPKCFKFHYRSMTNVDNALTLYGESVSVAPHSFKDKGVTYHVLEKTLLIQVEKSKAAIWSKIKIGQKDKHVSKSKTNEEKVLHYLKDVSDIEKQKEVDDPKLEIPDKPLISECRMQKDCDKLSVSCDDANSECTTIKICAETKEDIAAFFKQPLLPCSHYTQSNSFLFINIECKNINIQNFVVEQIDSKTFRYQYKHVGTGFAPLFYGGYVYTAPHTFKNKGVTHHISEDTLLIQVEKKKSVIWSKIKVGLDRKSMKECKLKGPKNVENEVGTVNKAPSSGGRTEARIRSRTESLSEDESETLRETEEEDSTLVEAMEEEKTVKSSEVKIPQLVRRTSDCFITGSWPRGILKARSWSLSESQMGSHVDDCKMDSYNNVFGSALQCEDEVVMEELEEEEKLELEEGGGSLPTKKSVRFNEFVCQQVFRVDASILGQKAKNQKKANQKKRARERRFSEGSQSSENETATDVATTEDESNTEGEGSGGRPSSNGLRERITKKRKEKSNKKNKKNKKPVLNLSSEITEMVFQLDDD